MGFLDMMKEQASTAKAAFERSQQRIAEDRRRQQEAEAERQRHLAQARKTAFSAASQSCPLPVREDKTTIAGGLELQNDEFVANIAKEWGFSTQKLTITTHRVVWSKGVVSTNQSAVYLTDIRDVRFHKPLIGAGRIILETSGGNSIEGLPFAANGAVVRDRLMAMIHWARQQTQKPTGAAQGATPPVNPNDHIDQLRRLGELKSQGILTQEEFQQEKAKILSLPG